MINEELKEKPPIDKKAVAGFVIGVILLLIVTIVLPILAVTIGKDEPAVFISGIVMLVIDVIILGIFAGIASS